MEPAEGIGADSGIHPPRVHEVGGYSVRRALPLAALRSVGPFVFLDHLGPAAVEAAGIQVAPHPHIGLATVTWLLEGELVHRDSLGTVQTIRPGELNWMSAGAGIVHSERSPAEDARASDRIHALQAWVALPREEESGAPSFQHYPAADLPRFEREGAELRLIAGEVWSRRSPVVCPFSTLYLDLSLEPGGHLQLPQAVEQLALYLVDGDLRLASVEVPSRHLAGCGAPGRRERIVSKNGARLVLLGGDALDGPRHMWWNFVATSPERIRQAAEQWRQHRFPDVPGDDGYIPLPAKGPPAPKAD